jgi:hypothetical protein
MKPIRAEIEQKKLQETQGKEHSIDTRFSTGSKINLTNIRIGF